ncbi:MAG: NAD(P)/FAD-dependent oxidoreductase [Verrucomicrobiae bacterium]|nr:NAD(P)/FAD-dependent oxidoreductase [Verrucomicrobiae bacterium]
MARKSQSSVEYDAVIIGSGPNGLGAANTLASEGWRVLVVESHETPGGGARSAELTLPGFVHDTCSAIHPMALASPLFQSLPLAEHGLEWIHPEILVAHPFDEGDIPAAAMLKSYEETAAGLGDDAAAYRRLFGPLVQNADALFGELLGPLPMPPKHPIALTQFGLRVLPSALAAARRYFCDEPARALFAGNAAHSVMPLDRPLATSAIGMMLMLAGHVHGWPFPKGGAGKITDALVGCLKRFGGEIVCGWRVKTLDELPKARAYLFDTAPSILADVAGDRLPEGYRRRLKRYRHGPGIFKIDYALSEAVPWASQACRRAGTVHVGGTLDEIVISEREAWNGIHAEKPFVLATQQSVFDETRAPEGKHTFWAYCHVPSGSTVDMTEAIENQIERFAPGFRDCILARHTMNCADFERYNPCLIGGDVVGGVADWRQLFTRPVARWNPYTTPANDIFIGSASTPPGGGVHGMAGYWAAQAVMSGHRPAGHA